MTNRRLRRLGGMNVSLCAEESEFDRDGCTCAAECSDIVSVTFVTIKVKSFRFWCTFVEHSPEREIK